MAEKNNEQQIVQHENTLSFDNRVLEKIAYYSVKEIDGILELRGDLTSNIKGFFSNNEDETKGISAEVGKKEVALDLDIIAEYGKNMPSVFQKTKDVLTRNVKNMTGLSVIEVNMKVSDVLTRSEYDKQQNDEKRRLAQEGEIAAQGGQYTNDSRVQ